MQMNLHRRPVRLAVRVRVDDGLTDDVRLVFRQTARVLPHIATILIRIQFRKDGGAARVTHHVTRRGEPMSKARRRRRGCCGAISDIPVRAHSHEIQRALHALTARRALQCMHLLCAHTQRLADGLHIILHTHRTVRTGTIR